MSTAGIDLRARYTFLDAIEKWWQPAPLPRTAALLPAIRDWSGWMDFEPNTAVKGRAALDALTRPPFALLRPYGWRWTWGTLEADTSPEAEKARAAVLEWWKPYGFEGARWILTSAIQTALVALFRKQSKPEQFIFIPPDNPRPRFMFNPPAPDPNRPVDDFLEDLRRAAMREIEAYKHRVLSFGSPDRNDEQHAEWTARSWAGESARRIYLKLTIDRPFHAESTSEVGIQKAIQRFAARIELRRPAH